jgi:hypothetical protein
MTKQKDRSTESVPPAPETRIMDGPRQYSVRPILFPYEQGTIDHRKIDEAIERLWARKK